MVCVSSIGLAQKKDDQSMEPMKVTEFSESQALKVEMMLIEGEKEYIKENYYKAYELFKAALEITPDNAALNFKTAEVLAKNGDNQNALVYATRAMELDPTNKFYLLLTAEIHKAMTNFNEAARIYQQMIDNIEGTDSYLFDLAIIYQFQGKYEQALETYARAERIYGMNEIVLREKQKIYLKNRDFESLIADWDKLINENPDQEQYVLELCEFLISQSLIKEAKARLERLSNGYAGLLKSQIALVEGNVQTAIALADEVFGAADIGYQSKLQLLNSLLEYATFENDLLDISSMANRLAEQYPEQYEVQAFTGDVMYRMKEEQAARNYYLKAIRISPSNYNVWQNILNIDANLNEYDSVIAHAEEALEYFPNQAVLYYFAGTGYLIEKNYKRSVQVLDQGKKYATDPNLLTILYGQLGDAYNSLEQPEKSFSSYEKALESNPDNDHVLNNYSYFLSLRNQDMDKALQMSTRLVQMHPENPTYLDTHGWVLYILKKYEEAESFLQKAANLGEDGTIIEHYGDVLFRLGKVDKAVEQWKRAETMDDASKNIQKKIADKKLYE